MVITVNHKTTSFLICSTTSSYLTKLRFYFAKHEESSLDYIKLLFKFLLETIFLVILSFAKDL